MTDVIRPVVFLTAVLFATASGQIPQSAPAPQIRGHFVQAEIVDSKEQPLRYSFLELRALEQGETGVRAAGDIGGKVVIPSVESGRYELSLGAGGFITLSRTVEIDGDKDLGRMVLDADPNVLHASASAIGFLPAEADGVAAPIRIITTPRVIRGRIEFPVASGRRLTVQLACSVQLPGANQRPQRDVAQVPLNGEGVFEAAVPRCSGGELAHRELRFSLKDEHGGTIALLIPKMTLQGYDQSRIGIWLPLNPVFEQSPIREATFFPEFTDNRPLQAKISISPSRDRFVAGETIFMNYTLTNNSDEVLALPSTSFESTFAWTILDDHGERVPLRLFQDRTGALLDKTQAVTNRIIFPGESESGMINLSFLFSLTAPGTYKVLARRIVHRPELPGEEQVTSAESTIVIDPLTLCELVKKQNLYDGKVVVIKAAIRSSGSHSEIQFDHSCPGQIRLESFNDASLLTDDVYQSLSKSLETHRAVEATISGKFKIVLVPSAEPLLTFTLHRVLSIR